MNAVNNAMKEIRHSIPEPILEFAFKTIDRNRTSYSVTIDELIKRKVILDRVLPDCNIVGGEQVIIPLDNIPYTELESGFLLYHIPSESTQGRDITSVLSVATGDHRLDTNSNSITGTSTAFDNFTRVIESQTAYSNENTNRVRLVGRNSILLEDRLTSRNLYLRCVLNSDISMSFFSQKSYLSFAHLCLLAVKAYIYNVSILPVNAGELTGGVTLGRFKEVIDSFSDTNEMYREYLIETFGKVSMQQDREAHRRHLSTVCPSFY